MTCSSLPIFIESFIKDFEFEDVKDQVQNLFENHELEAILSEKKRECQIRRLFWILCEKNNDRIIDQFLNKIEKDHEFLTEPVRNLQKFRLEEQRNVNTPTQGNTATINANFNLYLDEVRKLRSKNHNFTDFNIHRMLPYVRLHRALISLERCKNVVLFGELGTGKKWLALDVCLEYTIMEAMDFKIFWLDVSKCTTPEDDLNMLLKLRQLLDPNEQYNSNGDAKDVRSSLSFLRTKMRSIFQSRDYRNSLLVLKNVQNVKTLKAFNLHCKVLVITRNNKVSESLSSKMSTHLKMVDYLREDEFFCLFEKELGRHRNSFPANAKDIYYNSNKHPLLLSIIAKNLRQNSNWNRWIKELRSLTEANTELNSVMELALKVLDEELLALYAMLAIFEHSINIPIELLATIWNLSLLEAEDVVNKFHKHSFLNREQMTVQLPFIYKSLLCGSKRMKRLIDPIKLHRKVVDHYKVGEVSDKRIYTESLGIYFYTCLGYHLKEADLQRGLFSNIFLDFGFLENKIRAVSLLNTIGDLKYYKNEICDLNHRHRDLVYDLCDFLTMVEEKINKNITDTCLLQYALTANGSVYEEAMRQVKKFPDQVWFIEKGNFHQRRQILPLGEHHATLVQYIRSDICLILLKNEDLHLTDISFERNSDVARLNDDNTSITGMRAFCNDEYLLTVHGHGVLKLWRIAGVLNEIIAHRRSCEKQIHPSQTNICTKNVLKQTIQSKSTLNIVAFYLEQNKSDTYIHVAFENGDISRYEWKKTECIFERDQLPTMQTKLNGIRFLTKIFNKYYIMSTDGKFSIWNLRNSAKVCLKHIDDAAPETQIVYFDTYESTDEYGKIYTNTLFVTKNKVFNLSFLYEKYSELEGTTIKPEIIYELKSHTHSSITCAKLSRDAHYLILGTQQGLSVFDMHARLVVLRSNVSESITCVDIYDSADPIFKYIIICGAVDRKLLNIYALRYIEGSSNSIGWAHTLPSISNKASDVKELEEADACLSGRKLYDITYNGGTHLIAADSINRIHQVCTNDTKNWTIITPPETKHRITAVTTFGGISYVGYENGYIFKIGSEKLERVFEPNAKITYMQLINAHTLVVSSKEAHATTIRDLHVNLNLDCATDHCFNLQNDYLLLLNECGFRILDLQKRIQQVEDIQQNLGGFDLKNSFLFVATTSYKICIYRFNNIQHKFKIISFFEKEKPCDNVVTCLAASNNTNMCAIGLEIGDIEVYKKNENDRLQYIFRLQSHKAQIYDMKFSPEDNVLVSSSEQMCFWSVPYMLNNPLPIPKHDRVSSRFRSSRCCDREEIDARPTSPHEHIIINVDELNNVMNTVNLDGGRAWRRKQGLARKPELLSCIKFDGNKAEKIFANHDFTQFNTIDDEGVYYHLTLLHVDDNSAGDNDDGDGNNNGGDIVVHRDVIIESAINIDHNDHYHVDIGNDVDDRPI